MYINCATPNPPSPLPLLLLEMYQAKVPPQAFCAWALAFISLNFCTTVPLGSGCSLPPAQRAGFRRGKGSSAHSKVRKLAQKLRRLFSTKLPGAYKQAQLRRGLGTRCSPWEWTMAEPAAKRTWAACWLVGWWGYDWNQNLGLNPTFNTPYTSFLFFTWVQIFTSALLLPDEKLGPENRFEPKNTCLFFPSQETVTTLKNRVPWDPYRFFPYTRKTGTQKTGRGLSKMPPLPKILIYCTTTHRTHTHHATEATQHNYK